MPVTVKAKEEVPRFVCAAGVVTLYHEKAPYEKSGVSLKGALEYDPDDDTVRCHECGVWGKRLGPHIRQAHGLDVREYKKRHGLGLTTALIGETARQRLVAVGLSRRDEVRLKLAPYRTKSGVRSGPSSKYAVHELHNARGTCRPQCLAALARVAEQVGHTPSLRELKECGLSATTLRFHFGSVRAALKAASLVPRRRGDRSRSKEELVQLLKNFFKLYGRAPTSSDMKRGLVPWRDAYARQFGSWRQALLDCGIPGPRTRRNWLRKAVLDGLSRWVTQLGRFPSDTEFRRSRPAYVPTRKVFNRIFGGLTQTAKAVGYKKVGRNLYERRK